MKSNIAVTDKCTKCGNIKTNKSIKYTGPDNLKKKYFSKLDLTSVLAMGVALPFIIIIFGFWFSSQFSKTSQITTTSIFLSGTVLLFLATITPRAIFVYLYNNYLLKKRYPNYFVSDSLCTKCKS